MKSKGLYVFVTITFLFIGFTAGFFVGRNYNTGSVLVSTLPSAGTSNPTSAGDGSTLSADEPTQTQVIDINTATVSELSTLPGIGEVIAQRIVDYRELHGNFARVADLLNIDGIGQKRLEQILDYITVGG